MNGPLGVGGTPKKALVSEGPPADVGAGDAAEALAGLDAGADPRPPKPAVPGDGPRPWPV